MCIFKKHIHLSINFWKIHPYGEKEGWEAVILLECSEVGGGELETEKTNGTMRTFACLMTCSNGGNRCLNATYILPEPRISSQSKFLKKRVIFFQMHFPRTKSNSLLAP